jgi:hypothetical protein
MVVAVRAPTPAPPCTTWATLRMPAVAESQRARETQIPANGVFMLRRNALADAPWAPEHAHPARSPPRISSNFGRNRTRMPSSSITGELPRDALASRQ